MDRNMNYNVSMGVNHDKLTSLYVKMQKEISKSVFSKLLIKVDADVLKKALEEVNEAFATIHNDCYRKETEVMGMQQVADIMKRNMERLEYRNAELEEKFVKFKAYGTMPYDEVFASKLKEQEQEICDLRARCEKQTDIEKENAMLREKLLQLQEETNQKDVKLALLSNQINEIQTREAAIIRENRYLNLVQQAENEDVKRLKSENQKLIGEIKQGKENLQAQQKKSTSLEEKFTQIQKAMENQNINFRKSMAKHLQNAARFDSAEENNEAKQLEMMVANLNHRVNRYALKAKHLKCDFEKETQQSKVWRIKYKALIEEVKVAERRYKQALDYIQEDLCFKEEIKAELLGLKDLVETDKKCRRSSVKMTFKGRKNGGRCVEVVDQILDLVDKSLRHYC